MIARPAELVVVVHGLAMHPWLMKPLARRLELRGFATHRFGYNTLQVPIARTARRFSTLLHACDANPRIDRVHVVAHSMGGLVTRAALRHHRRPAKLHRCVFLGPPNRGSDVAAFFGPILGWAFPTITELASRPGNFLTDLGDRAPADTGIVAGTRDRLVKPRNTRLRELRDWISVDCGHAALLYRDDVADLVARFLHAGAFAKREDATVPGTAAIETAALLPTPAAGTPGPAGAARVPASPCPTAPRT